MSDAPVPAPARGTHPAGVSPAGVGPALQEEPRKLDDVMLAMDVVDTLRHRTRIVDMELNEEAREEQLVTRLKEIYGAQGIEVPERILRDGVRALAEQRFVYKPPADTIAVRLARLYVGRKKWLPGLLALTGAIVAALLAWQVFWEMPRAAEWRELPNRISRTLAEGRQLAEDPAVDARLASLAAEGQRAAANGDRDAARAQLGAMEAMVEKLAQEYDIRIVVRPDQLTVFWRQSDLNPAVRNYYVVVEAVAPGGQVLKVPIENIETQTTETVSLWAQRVSRETFDRIDAEKAASGLVSNDILGRKARGQLEPTFDEPVPGGAITKW